MKHLKPFSVLRTLFLVVVGMVSASAGAAPILTNAQVSTRGPVAGAEAPLFSNMRLNGGQNSTVAFIGDDNSILIGHYARGPWSKAEFLRSWQNGGNNGSSGGNGGSNSGNNGGNGGGGRGDYLPPVETVTNLPEPSTFALLALGLLTLGVMRRRQTNR